MQGFRLAEEVTLPGMVRMAVRFAAAALSLSPVLHDLAVSGEAFVDDMIYP